MPILMTNINSYHTAHNPYIDMHICGFHNNDRVFRRCQEREGSLENWVSASRDRAAAGIRA